MLRLNYVLISLSKIHALVMYASIFDFNRDVRRFPYCPIFVSSRHKREQILLGFKSLRALQLRSPTLWFYTTGADSWLRDLPNQLCMESLSDSVSLLCDIFWYCTGETIGFRQALLPLTNVTCSDTSASSDNLVWT